MRAEGRAAVAIVAVFVVVAAVDTVLGREVVLLGALLVAPLIACAYLGPRGTAAAGAATVTMAVGLGVPNGIFGTVDHVARTSFIVIGTVISVWLARRRVLREADLLRMTQIAAVVQEAILQPLPSRVGDVEVAACYVSASKDAVVGGDLYEVASTPFGVRVILGDVRGKGLDAVRLAARVMTAFRDAVYTIEDLELAAAAVDAGISDVLGDEDFVTAIIAEVGRDELRVVSCGHHPPLLSAGGGVRLLEPSAPDRPLGLDPDVRVDVYGLAPGDRVLLYTDGLVEARSPSGEWFPLLERASAALRRPDMDDALDALVDDLLDHVGGDVLKDDLALLLLEV